MSTDGPNRGTPGLARSAGVVGGATLASRVSGLARDIVVANLFAIGATDSFFVAFTIPNLFRRLVAEGSLTVSFVPVFTGCLERSREEAKRVLDSTWTLGALAGLVIMGLGIAFADPLVRGFAPGFALEPEKHELCVRLLRLCFPYILFLSLVAVAMGALNALGHFLVPAIAPVLLNLCLIGGALAGIAWLEPPVMALGYAVIVAGALQLWLQYPALSGVGMRPSFTTSLRHPAVRRLGALMLPAVAGASVFQINVVVSRFLASYLGDGAVSYLYYADRLLEFPLGVFVFALGAASLPSFSRLAKRGDLEGLRAEFGRTLGLSVALTLPSTLGLILLREPIFEVLFAWNPSVFGAAAVQGCAWALLFYAIGLVPIAVARVCVMLSVANEDTRVPAHGAVVGVVVHAIAALTLIGPLPPGALPESLRAVQAASSVADLGYAGLALAASVGSAANALYLWIVLRSRRGPLLRRRDLAHLGQTVAASCALAAAVAFSTWLAPVGGETASWAGVALLALHVALGAGAYAGALHALGSEDLGMLIAALRRRQRA